MRKILAIGLVGCASCGGGNYIEGRNNYIIGSDNDVVGSYNYQITHNVDVTGDNNVLVGANYKASGNNIHMFGPTTNFNVKENKETSNRDSSEIQNLSKQKEKSNLYHVSVSQVDPYLTAQENLRKEIIKQVQPKQPQKPCQKFDKEKGQILKSRQNIMDEIFKLNTFKALFGKDDILETQTSSLSRTEQSKPIQQQPRPVPYSPNGQAPLIQNRKIQSPNKTDSPQAREVPIKEDTTQVPRELRTRKFQNSEVDELFDLGPIDLNDYQEIKHSLQNVQKHKQSSSKALSGIQEMVVKASQVKVPVKDQENNFYKELNQGKIDEKSTQAIVSEKTPHHHSNSFKREQTGSLGNSVQFIPRNNRPAGRSHSRKTKQISSISQQSFEDITAQQPKQLEETVINGVHLVLGKESSPAEKPRGSGCHCSSKNCACKDCHCH